MNTKEEKTRYIQSKDGEHEAHEHDKEQFTQRRIINGCAANPSLLDGITQVQTTTNQPRA
jgi:hypothetical protein